MKHLIDLDSQPGRGFGRVIDREGRPAEVMPVVLPLACGLRRVAILTAVVDVHGRLCLGVRGEGRLEVLR